MGEINLRTVRRAYSRMGLAYLLFFVIATLSQVAYLVLAEGYRDVMGEGLYIMFGLLVMYPAAFPLCWLVIRTLPKRGPSWQFPVGGPRFAAIFILCIGAMFAGNLIGQILMYFVQMYTGQTMSNAVEDVIMEMDIWSVMLSAVIIGPILEELLFRKFLLDRVACFGQMTAVLMSGFLFGIAHGNFYQFFYAFALGLIFAYVYLRTGRIRYTIILHILLNFCGSIVPMLMQQYMEIHEKAGTLMVLGWALFLLVSAVAGLFILLLGRRQIWFYRMPWRVPSERWFVTVVLNAGVILFFIYEAVNFLLG